MCIDSHKLTIPIPAVFLPVNWPVYSARKRADCCAHPSVYLLIYVWAHLVFMSAFYGYYTHPFASDAPCTAKPYWMRFDWHILFFKEQKARAE